MYGALIFLGLVVLAVGKDSPKPECLMGQHFDAPDSASCGAYWHCDNGQLSHNTCGFMKKFDHTKKHCEWSLPFNSVDCSTGKNLNIDGYRNAAVRKESPKPECLMGQHFDAPDPDSCGSYWHCENGQLDHKSCGFMKKFNGITKQCEWSFPFDAVDCTAGRPTPPPPSTGPQTAAPTSSPSPSDCQQGQHFVKPDTIKNCAAYWECSDGKFVKKQCGFMKKFNAMKKQCEVSFPFFEVDCWAGRVGPTPPTPPTPTTTSGTSGSSSGTVTKPTPTKKSSGHMTVTSVAVLVITLLLGLLY